VDLPSFLQTLHDLLRGVPEARQLGTRFMTLVNELEAPAGSAKKAPDVSTIVPLVRVPGARGGA